MGIFKNILGNWVQVVDDKNELTIEDYGYDSGIIVGTTGNHCVKCVAVNKCYFKDERGKKPEPFDIHNIKILDMMNSKLIPGLYHPFCHCMENSVAIDKIDEISLIVPPGKIDYLFKKKSEWVDALGYHENDREKFVAILLERTKEAYFYGDYYIENISNYGFKINIKITIPGANEKLNKDYKLETNYMIFPNKKLKMNTPIGGWQK